MKNLFLVLAISALTFSALSFTEGKDITAPQKSNSDTSFEMPDDVQAIVDNSCYGCHNSESKNTKGKMKLKFDKMPKMSKGKLIGKLSKISKSVTKGKMPPEKAVNKHPEMALSKDDVTTLTTWANDFSKKLSGE
jgi:cytochrome c551/c552